MKSLWDFDIPDIIKTRYSGVDVIKRISKSANSEKRFGTALASNIATFLIILLKINLCYLIGLSNMKVQYIHPTKRCILVNTGFLSKLPSQDV